jgi:hypothetical protein
MSLDSCLACGHALAIADQRCRHCSPAKAVMRKGVQGIAFYLLAGFGTLVLGVLIYNMFHG